MDVTVVIPTFNRATTLMKVLPTYLAPSCVGEVIIVDDGSRDNTGARVREAAQRDHRIQYIQHVPHQGMTFARNTGIRHAHGELILFSEDDLGLVPGSLETLVSHLEQTGADIIAGRRIWMRVVETPEQALERANRQRGGVVNTRLLEHNSHAVAPADVESPLVSATMLVRRRVLARVEFASCYGGNAWREESDFQLAAQELGFRVFFCPHALSFHYDRPGVGRGLGRLRGSLQSLRWIFLNNLTFLRRHRGYLRERIPEALILGSPFLTTVPYVAHRSLWLVKAELRRGWQYGVLGRSMG